MCDLRTSNWDKLHFIAPILIQFSWKLKLNNFSIAGGTFRSSDDVCQDISLDFSFYPVITFMYRVAICICHLSQFPNNLGGLWCPVHFATKWEVSSFFKIRSKIFMEVRFEVEDSWGGHKKFHHHNTTPTTNLEILHNEI